MQTTAPGEIAVRETKPATEWILGRAVRKVSPKRRHARLQRTMMDLLNAWSLGPTGDRGEALPEWRFRVSPPGEEVRPLVPDVAWMSFARLRPLSAEERETPHVAPEIVVEVVSPGDKAKNIAEKQRVYSAWGVDAQVWVDPDRRTLWVIDRKGPPWQEVTAAVESFALPSFPDLVLPVRQIFEALDNER